MVATIADNEHRMLNRMEVNVAAFRDMEKPTDKISIYDAVRIKFRIWGVSTVDAELLVKIWKQRWPIYGSVAVATADTTVEFEIL